MPSGNLHAHHVEAIRLGKARVAAGDGFMYVAEWRSRDVIKIGHALNVERRIKEFSIGGYCRLLGSFPASIVAERAFHKRMRAHQVDGECYSRDWLITQAAQHEAA